MVKDSRPGMQEKSRSISNPFLKDKTAKGPPGNDLCALCFLPSDFFIFICGGYKESKIFIP
jgi:hypothetical protein